MGTDSSKAFIGQLSESDRARIGTFGAEIAISSRLTSDKAYLRRILDEEVWPGGGTPLWRAVDLAMTSLPAEEVRRVILLLTDGFDNTDLERTISGRSTHDPLQMSGGNTMALPMSAPPESRPLSTVNIDSVGDRAVRENFMIYAVGRALEKTSNAGALSSKMQVVATESGGGYRRVPRSQDAAEVMSQIAEELRHQYLLGFAPLVRDGKVHKLALRIRRGGMSVHTRKSYVAAK